MQLTQKSIQSALEAAINLAITIEDIAATNEIKLERKDNKNVERMIEADLIGDNWTANDQMYWLKKIK